ncbi:MAG: polysaccharide deacetylase family protein [Bacteroidales bacterium]|nr:polysaccharide deacetylase family protein [Bacteroidales bacterium]
MIVLMYHDIVTANDKSSGFQNKNAFQYKVEESAFEEQVKALQGKDVVFTFDDGGVSFLTKAVPILEKYGFKGVFLVSTNYIGTPGFLTSEQVRELAERGHVIGSHSHTHPEIFTKLSSEEIKREWQQSSQVLKDILGEGEYVASIPNGYTSEEILDAAIQNGFNTIYTSQPTTNIKTYKNSSLIGRYVVLDGMSTEDVLKLVSSKSCHLKMAVKWHLLNIVKGVLGTSYETFKAKILHH